MSAVLLLLLLATSAAVAAQSITADSELRVRVRTSVSKSTMVGTYAGRTRDSILIRMAGHMMSPARTVPVAVAEVTSVERSVSSGHYGLVGGVAGLALGVGVGSVIASGRSDGECASTESDPLCLGEGVSRAVSSGLIVVGSALLGLLLGAVVGSEISDERWEVVGVGTLAVGGWRVVPSFSARGVAVRVGF